MENTEGAAQTAAFLLDIYGDDSVDAPAGRMLQAAPASDLSWDAADPPFLADLDVLELFKVPGVLDELDAVVDTDSPKDACVEGDACESIDASRSDTKSGSPCSSCDAVEPVQPRPRRKNNGGGNAARKRQRQEIHALRKETALLKKEIELLRVKKMGNLSGNRKSLLSGAGGGARDDDERVESLIKIERARLHRLVEHNERFVRQFETALRGYPSLVMSDIMADSGALWRGIQTVRESPTLEFDERVFDLLAGNIDARYLQVGQAFKDVGLKDSHASIYDARVDTNAHGFSSARIKTCQLIPFSVHQIDFAAKRASTDALDHESAAQVFKRSARCVAFKSQFVMGDTTVTIRTVSKRYHENDRTTIVIDAVNEWASASSDQVVTIEEKTWVVVKPYPDAETKDTKTLPGTSLFQACSFMTPVPRLAALQAPTNASHNTDVALLSNVVLPSYEQKHAARMQHLENTLLEHSLLQREHTESEKSALSIHQEQLIFDMAEEAAAQSAAEFATFLREIYGDDSVYSPTVSTP